MWHEARRREKATQKLLNEHRKRAEKRREENRIDPTSLLQVNGLKAKLCLDPSVYKQASKSLMAWQGDKSVTIDRFDVRATLSAIPDGGEPSGSASIETTTKQPAKSPRNVTVLDANESEPVKKLLNYERYRLLVQNDLNKVPEELRLKMVSQSDVSADAKMRKLSYNKFGTAGDASIVDGNQSLSSSSKLMGQSSLDATRRVGSSSSHTYSSVPPPPNLIPEGSIESSSASKVSDTSMAKNLAIMDLDEFENFELDGIGDFSNHDCKRINEVARKYGLSMDELLIMAKRDNQDIETANILRELKKLTRESDSDKLKEKASAPYQSSSQVYGPALPPELLKQNQLSSSLSSSSHGSPIRQRSPSGAQIPLRNGYGKVEGERNKSVDYTNGDYHLTRIDCGSPEVEQSPAQTVLDHSSYSDSSQKPEKLGIQSSGVQQRDSALSEDKESKEDTGIEFRRERRASTPLIYQRSRRSSRSLSRERRANRFEYSLSSGSRRSRRSRSRSRSSCSSSTMSTLSTSSSKSSGKYRRRTYRPRRRRRRRRAPRKTSSRTSPRESPKISRRTSSRSSPRTSRRRRH